MSRTISNHDDVIDSRDIIERLEELEALRKPWVAGWNMPGYMPDSEPARFESFEEARDYIADEMQRAADEAFDAAADIIEAKEASSPYDAAIERLQALDGANEYGETVDNNHYWISADDSASQFEDPSDFDEWKALQALAEEAEGYAPDWEYGATLVRDSYFTAYTQELLEDCGDLPRDLPSYIEIDWEATARNIRVDYTSVEFDGVTYWVR